MRIDVHPYSLRVWKKTRVEGRGRRAARLPPGADQRPARPYPSLQAGGSDDVLNLELHPGGATRARQRAPHHPRIFLVHRPDSCGSNLRCPHRYQQSVLNLSIMYVAQAHNTLSLATERYSYV
jgi:hypothetical protein